MDLLSTIFDSVFNFLLIMGFIIFFFMSLLFLWQYPKRFDIKDDEQSESFDKIIINIRHVKESDDEDDNS